MDGLDKTERVGKGLGSREIGFELEETKPTINFLEGDAKNKFYHSSYMTQHPTLRKVQVLFSNTIIGKGNLKGFEADFWLNRGNWQSKI